MVAGVDGLRAAIISGSAPGRAAQSGRPPGCTASGVLRLHTRIRAAAAGGTWYLAAMACQPGDPQGAEARERRPVQHEPIDVSHRDAAERARQDSVNRAHPGYIVDSILPVREEIRRFQANLPRRAERLEGGATTRDSLVKAFVAAVEANDTTSLVGLMIDRAEFGYLVYPTSRYTRPPYRQSPDIVWLRIRIESNKSASRLLARLGGKPLGFTGYRCAPNPEVEGPNRLWSACVARHSAGTAGSTEMRLFGDIVERDGRFKFVSLSNGIS